MKNIRTQFKNTFLFLLITLFLLEGFTRIIPEPKSPELFHMEMVPQVEKTPWMPQWHRDHDQLRRNFRAYEIYRLDPFQGPTIHITDDGYRASASPAYKSEHLDSLGIFGGSTVWGSYARDDYTIPSAISNSLNQQNVPASVTNYAQVGFVFSQEVHEALRILYSSDAEHPKPHRMVFIDGVNDVLAGIHNYTQGVAHPQSLPWENQKYKYLFKLGNTGEVTTLDILKKLKCVRLAVRVMENRGWIKGEPKGVWVEPTPASLSQLARDVAQRYVNLATITHRALAANGIEATFVLQPILAEKEKPTDEEKKLLRQNSAWQSYLRGTYAEIRRLTNSLPADVGFLDMGNFFKDDADPVFSDVLHYSELGNKKIGSFVGRYLASRPLKHRLADSTH